MEIKEVGSYIEIYFDSIPSDIIRETMKTCGWKFFGKKCWSNYNNSENMQFAQSIYSKICGNDDDNALLGLEQHDLSPVNLIVRCNSFYCNANHQLIDIAAQVEVCNMKGVMVPCLIPAAYCISCDEYYILENTYQELKNRGIIMCQIMTRKEYQEAGRFGNDTGKWKDKSPLKIFGYSVSQADGLSDVQRQAILESLIDYKIMTKDRVLSYLDFIIKINGYKYDLAMGKWMEDREYISSYEIGTSKRVKAKGIILSRHK